MADVAEEGVVIAACSSLLVAIKISLLFTRCMECRRGLAMRILSVRLSVTRVDCDKTVERSSRFIYHTKEHLA